MAPEVADEREVVFRAEPGQGKVVMDARDGLHAPAVAMREAHAVDRLHAPDVGGAVVAERDLVVGRQVARHAGAPQELRAAVAAEGLVDGLVNARELAQAALHLRMHAGDELELRLAEIGRDVRMSERRAERGRMRGSRELAVGPHAQAFLLDAAADLPERGRSERSQALLESGRVAHLYKVIRHRCRDYTTTDFLLQRANFLLQALKDSRYTPVAVSTRGEAASAARQDEGQGSPRKRYRFV